MGGLKRAIFAALAVSSLCYSSATTVMYTNGVKNTRTEALRSLDQFRKMLRDGNIDTGGRYEFILGYNTSQGLFKDLLEASRQATALHASRIITQTLRFFQGKDSSPTRTLADSALQYEIRASLRSNLEQSNLDSIGVKFVTAINSGNRFLHITHSQGGLFANATYEDIPDHLRPFYRVLEIATPAEDVPLGMKYVTFYEDRAINLIRPFVLSLSGNIQYSPDVLPYQPPSWAGAASSFDSWYHPLWAYLEHPRARALITSKIKDLMSDVSYPAFQHASDWDVGEDYSGAGEYDITKVGYSSYRVGFWDDISKPCSPTDEVFFRMTAIGLRLSSTSYLQNPSRFPHGNSIVAKLPSTGPIGEELNCTILSPKVLYNALGLRSTHDVSLEYGASYVVKADHDSVISVIRYRPWIHDGHTIETCYPQIWTQKALETLPTWGSAL